MAIFRVFFGSRSSVPVAPGAEDTVSGGDDAPGVYVGERRRAQERRFQEKRRERDAAIGRTIRGVVDPEIIPEIIEAVEPEVAAAAAAYANNAIEDALRAYAAGRAEKERRKRESEHEFMIMW